jgi:hypothetical protein
VFFNLYSASFLYCKILLASANTTVTIFRAKVSGGSPYIDQALVVSGGEGVIRQRGERGNDHIVEGEKVKNISLE